MMLGCDIWCSTQTSRSSCCSFAELRQSTRTRLHTTHCPVHGSRSSTALPWWPSPICRISSNAE